MCHSRQDVQSTFKMRAWGQIKLKMICLEKKQQLKIKVFLFVFDFCNCKKRKLSCGLSDISVPLSVEWVSIFNDCI